MSRYTKKELESFWKVFNSIDVKHFLGSDNESKLDMLINISIKCDFDWNKIEKKMEEEGYL